MQKRKLQVASAGVFAAGSLALGVGLLGLDRSDNLDLKTPKVYPGPYLAFVLKVTDSDTLKLAVHKWPGEVEEVGLRIYGIDTPEKFQPKCALEKRKALDASNYVAGLVPPGTTVKVSDVQLGKFAGRVVGKVEYEAATGPDSIAKALMRRQFAVPYFGGTKTEDWCVE